MPNILMLTQSLISAENGWPTPYTFISVEGQPANGGVWQNTSGWTYTSSISGTTLEILVDENTGTTPVLPGINYCHKHLDVLLRDGNNKTRRYRVKEGALGRYRAPSGGGGPSVLSAIITRDGITVEVTSTANISDVVYPADQGPIAIITTGVVTIDSISPAAGAIGSRQINGSAKNYAVDPGNYEQPFDTDQGDYNPALIDGVGTTLSDGDQFMAYAAEANYVSDRRGVAEAYLPLVVSSTPRDVLDLSPVAVDGTPNPIGAPVWHTVDWSAKLAAIPKCSVTATTYPDWSAMEAAIQFNPGHGINHKASQGYEEAFVHDWLNLNGSTRSNWGGHTVRDMNLYTLSLLVPADPAGVTGPTPAQQMKFLQFMAGTGKQWHGTLKARNQNIKPDGAHHQFMQNAMSVYGYVVGDDSVFDDITPNTGDFSANYQQPFYLTQSIIDNDLVPHGDANDVDRFDDKPFPWQRRLILAKGFDGSRSVADGQYWVDFRSHRGGNSGQQGDPSKGRVNGMTMTDGTNTLPIVTNTDIPPTYSGGVVTGSFRGYFTTDPTAFPVGATIWFDQAMTPGVDWCITGYHVNPSHYTPVGNALYRILQFPVANVMFTHSIGKTRPGWEALIDLMELGNSPSNPWIGNYSGIQFNDYHDSDLSRAIWDTCWASSISQVPQSA